MARQTGIIKLTGTLNGINLYTRQGKALARKAGGGFNSHDIKHKPSMKRVRENSSEFGRCSRTKKHFNRALRPFLCHHKDTTLHGRLMRLFTSLKKLDSVHERGQRQLAEGIHTPMGIQLLKDFNFTPSCRVSSHLLANVTYNSAQRILHIASLNIKSLPFASGATHMALTLGVLHFDFFTNRYELSVSTPAYIDKTQQDSDVYLQAAAPALSGTCIAVMGVKFYQEVQGRYMVFKSKDAVGLSIIHVGN